MNNIVGILLIIFIAIIVFGPRFSKWKSKRDEEKEIENDPQR